MKLSKSTLIATALVAAGFVGNASAQAVTTSPQSTTFLVTIGIQKACEIIGADPIDFGNEVLPVAGDIDKTGAIVVECTNGTQYKLGLDGGRSGNVANREMAHADGTAIRYQLYQEGGDSAPVWGQIATNQHVTGTGAGLGDSYQRSHTVYATATLVGNEVAGAYEDEVTATLEF